MLTPDELAHMTDALQEQLATLEDDIVRDIARRIVKTGNLTETAQWQIFSLQQAGLLYDEILQRVAAAAGKTKAEVQRIFTQAGETSFQTDAAVYRAAGLPVRKTMSAAMQQVIFSGWQKTFGQIDNLTKTTALEAQNAFISALNRAERQVESGAFDAVTAIRHAVQQAATGGAWVQYPSGHRDRLDVAVRRAVLTGVSQTTGDISLQNAREMGCDLMKIDAHAGARPSHAVWQGKVVSISGQPGYLSLEDIGYGTGPGFKGWNCGHDWFPYLGEISDRIYPPEKLREYEQRTVEYEGETMSYYDATQRQRAMERAVRADKRELAGLDEAIKAANDPAMKTGLQSDFTRVSARLKEHEGRLRDFTRQTGLVRQREREQVLGFGRSQASKAVHQNKNYQVWLEKKAEFDKMVMDLKDGGFIPKQCAVHIPPKSIDIEKLTFDNLHINKERHHNVSRENAETWLRESKLSLTVWGGKFERYYGTNGAVYIDLETENIRTAFSSKEFTEQTQQLLEVLKRYGY